MLARSPKLFSVNDLNSSPFEPPIPSWQMPVSSYATAGQIGRSGPFADELNAEQYAK